MSKIGILGGSFDPIHLGHENIIKASINELNLDKILIVPTKNNPWKDDCVASDKQRIDMINLAIQDLDKAEVSTIEIDEESNDKNFTYVTVGHLLKTYKDDELFLIMGMDQASQFNKWKNSDYIHDNVNLVCFDRIGYKSNEIIKKYDFIKLNITPSDESSTAIKEGNIKYLNSNVLKYIIDNELYLDGFIKSRMSKKRYEHSKSVAKLCKAFAKDNNVDEHKAFLAGMFHDIAKEIEDDKAQDLMEKYYPEYASKPKQIYHQWLSAYICKKDFLITDKNILDAIEVHTTGGINMDKLAKCLYCADKYDPLRKFDSSKQIDVCKKDIDKGFQLALKEFYDFSKENDREIDEIFYTIYDKYIGGRNE